MGKESTKHYKAFISYSHDNEEFGAWLHKQLERYKIPKRLREDYPHLPKTLYPIFRDRYELNAGDDLGVEISKALENSDALIVVCSTKSASSKWVNREIVEFKMKHGEEKIFPIIVDGVPFAKESKKYDDSLECFPEALKYKVDNEGNLTHERTEKLASNFNKSEDGEELAKLKLIAGVLGVPFGEFYKRDTIYREEELEKIQKQKDELEKSKNETQKQLEIAEKKTKILQTLTKKTIDTLMLSNENLLFKYIKTILNSGDREVFVEMLKVLIEETESMNNDEKEEWINALSYMTNEQMHRLSKILTIEAYKLRQLELSYQKKILPLNQKHLEEWIVLSKKICMDNKDENCLTFINSVLENPNILDKSESIIDYFKLYRQSTNNVSAEYYNVFGKYLLTRNKKECAVKFLQKSIEMDSENIGFLEDLIEMYRDDKDKALKLQYKIVALRERELRDIWSKEIHNLDSDIRMQKVGKNILETKRIELPFILYDDIAKLFKLEQIVESINVITKSYPKYQIFIESMIKKALSRELLFDKDIYAPISLEYVTNEHDMNKLVESSNQKKEDIIKTYLTIKKMLASCYAEKQDYNSSIESLEKLLDVYSQTNLELNESWIADSYLSLSWYYLIMKDYLKSIESSKKAIEINIDGIIAYEMNLAHGYLLSKNFKNAKKLYLKNIGKKIWNHYLWEEVIKDDFKSFREYGIYSDNFKRIEKILKEQK